MRRAANARTQGAVPAKPAAIVRRGATKAVPRQAVRGDRGYELLIYALHCLQLLTGRPTKHRQMGQVHWEALRFYAGIYNRRRLTVASQRARPDGVKAFATFFGLFPTTAGRAIDRLVEMGLLIKSDASVALGGYVVAITPAGLEMLADDPLRDLGAVLDAALTDDQREAFGDAVAVLTQDSMRRSSDAQSAAIKPRR
ncbi:MAG: hypothetical protein IBJ15_08675 [Alphaproteobacteria bacterium]|nr:hypothetical protein [Alphaproteobacteria bacterium]